MTRFFSIIFAVLASLSLAACDDFGRKYPPGYTDDGIKFEEDNWRYWPSTDRIILTYSDLSGSSVFAIACRPGLSLLGNVSISVHRFEPLQQWPQPELRIETGDASVAELPSVSPTNTGDSTMKIQLSGRGQAQVLTAIREGKPVSLTFDDQTLEAPGPPQSMREGFADKCRAKD